ncbi:hypothetical protein [Labilibaculum euxinus]
MAKNSQQECFIIMPISDPKDYDKGHFKRVYEDIITPACDKADYKAVRADEVEETDIIHLSILKKLIEAPMAICDLSTRNPNVLFELGLRQAFDKPVVLIQEKGTERIFDVSILRAYDYCKELRYNDVLNDQEAISKMLKGTEKAFVTGEGFNSVIKLLSLSQSAQIKTIDDPNEQFKMQLFQMSSQMDDISSELRSFRNKEKSYSSRYRSDKMILERKPNIEMFFDQFMKSYKMKDFEEMLKYYEIARMECSVGSDLEHKMISEMQHILENIKMNKMKI